MSLGLEKRSEMESSGAGESIVLVSPLPLQKTNGWIGESRGGKECEGQSQGADGRLCPKLYYDGYCHNSSSCERKSPMSKVSQKAITGPQKFGITRLMHDAQVCR